MADEEEAAGRSLPPYMLKVANLLGDVRLQNCPSPEGQDELYFTAQWEHDGGGVYDITKFTQPEVICASATCLQILLDQLLGKLAAKARVEWLQRHLCN